MFTRFCPLAQSCEYLFSHPIDITKDFSIDELKQMMRDIVDDWYNTLTIDIMTYGSFSQGEAMYVAGKMMLSGIKPKSDEFYKKMSQIKTMWEY